MEEEEKRKKKRRGEGGRRRAKGGEERGPHWVFQKKKREEGLGWTLLQPNPSLREQF